MTVRYPGRERLDLGGEWSFEPLARTEFREAGVLHEDTADLPAGGTMPVPSNWHQHGLDGFHGRVAFRRDLPEVDGDGWWLCLAGVDYLAEVSVDGTLLARHEGAFDGFDVRVPAGAKQLEVVVDAPREELGTLWPYRKRQFKGIFTQWEPLQPFQQTTGGIWGDVWLERRPGTHLAEVTATTFLVPRPRIDDDGAYVESGARDARVLVEVEVHAERPATEELTVEVAGAAASRVVDVAPGVTRHRLAVTVVDPALWWPWDVGDPVLHDLDVRLGDDQAHDRIGLREVGFDATTGAFTVNGREVRVRGSNVIPDKWLAGYGSVAADVELIRGAHLNAVRVCVHVTTDAFYDACDEAGLLVWQDLPLQWDYLITDAMVVEAADQAQRIVQRLANHASIALWSCHNEPFPADAGNFVGPLVRAVRAVDGTRTVHPASDFSEHAYPGWFVGDLRDYRSPAPPIVTEFGAVAFPSAAELRAMGAEWPPGGPAWDAVLHEPTPTLDVAGVDLGDSLEEAVLASQRYQARAVQTGVEAYRTQGRNYLHFLLMDGWPNVSWAVVSYDRVAKLGHAALARASQPVLIGAELTREVLSDAWDSHRFGPLAGGVWVVNDTDEALHGATWRALLGGHEVASGTLDVQPGVVSRWLPPGQRWPSWEPPDLPEGQHELELVLTDAGGTERSRNAYTLTVVHRGLDLRPPHERQR